MYSNIPYYTQHTGTHPDKYQDFSIADTVFSFGHSDHWELGRTLAPLHKI